MKKILFFLLIPFIIFSQEDMSSEHKQKVELLFELLDLKNSRSFLESKRWNTTSARSIVDEQQNNIFQYSFERYSDELIISEYESEKYQNIINLKTDNSFYNDFFQLIESSGYKIINKEIYPDQREETIFQNKYITIVFNSILNSYQKHFIKIYNHSEEEERIKIFENKIKNAAENLKELEQNILSEKNLININEELDIEEADTDKEEIIEILEEEEEEEILSFNIVENPPLFKWCDSDGSIQEQQACFQKGVMYHIRDNFAYPAICKEMGISERIIVNFHVSKKGKVTNVQVVRGNDKHLKAEALRLVKSIPDLIPAKQRGQAVSISFTVPISFTLQ